jgi:hypothetical protein
MGDSSTVTQMACKTCKMFAPADRVSRLRNLYLIRFSVYLLTRMERKYGLAPFCPLCSSCNVQSFIWSWEWVQ